MPPNAILPTTRSPTSSLSSQSAPLGSNPEATDHAVEASLDGSVRRWLQTRAWNLEHAECINPEHRHEPKTLPALTQKARDIAIATLERSLMPIPGNECRKMLARLKLMTIARDQTAEDLRLAMEMYLEALRDFPADVVRHVLMTQAAMSKWWPAWAELKDRLELHTKRRREWLRLLRRPTTDSSFRSSSTGGLNPLRRALPKSSAAPPISSPSTARKDQGPLEPDPALKAMWEQANAESKP